MRHIRAVFAVCAVVLSVGSGYSQTTDQKNQISARIHLYLDQMTVVTATPWSIDKDYNLVGRTNDQENEWGRLSDELRKAVVASRPSDIDQETIDGLVGQACDPYGWENSSVHVALAHVGQRAITKYISAIEAAPATGNYSEYLSRGLAEVLSSTRATEIDSSLIDKIADGLNNPDISTSIHFAQALGAIGPPASRSVPRLEILFQRALKEDEKVPVIAGGIWFHDAVRWQIESITRMPYKRTWPPNAR